MRQLPIIVGAALLSAVLAPSNQADAAMPALSLDCPDAVSSALEKVGYYGRRWYGYRPYYRPYYRPNGYYRPYYRPYGYGYGRPYRYRY